MGVQVPPRTLAYFVSSLYGAKSLFRRPTTKRAVTWFWRRCYSDSGLDRQSFSNSHCRCRCSTPTGMGSEQIHQATRVHRPSHAANQVCLRIAPPRVLAPRQPRDSRCLFSHTTRGNHLAKYLSLLQPDEAGRHVYVGLPRHSLCRNMRQVTRAFRVKL